MTSAMFILDISRGFSVSDYTKKVQGQLTTLFQCNGRAQINRTTIKTWQLKYASKEEDPFKA